MSEKLDAYFDIFERYAQRMTGRSQKWYFPNDSKYVDRKIQKFIRNFFIPVEWDDIVTFLDTTVFHTGKEGLLFTTNGIFVKEPLEKIYYLDFKEIQEVGYHVEIDEAQRETKTIEVTYKDGRVRRVFDYYFEQYLFEEYLKAAVELAKKYE